MIFVVGNLILVSDLSNTSNSIFIFSHRSRCIYRGWVELCIFCMNSNDVNKLSEIILEVSNSINTKPDMLHEHKVGEYTVLKCPGGHLPIESQMFQ